MVGITHMNCCSHEEAMSLSIELMSDEMFCEDMQTHSECIMVVVTRLAPSITRYIVVHIHDVISYVHKTAVAVL